MKTSIQIAFAILLFFFLGFKAHVSAATANSIKIDTYNESENPIASAKLDLTTSEIVHQSEVLFINGADTVKIKGKILALNRRIDPLARLRIKIYGSNELLDTIELRNVEATPNGAGSELALDIALYPRRAGYDLKKDSLSLSFYYPNEDPILEMEFRNLPPGEEIRTLAWISPIVSQKNSKAYVISLFKAKPKGEAAFKHLSTPDIKRFPDSKRFENKRWEIYESLHLGWGYYINVEWYRIDEPMMAMIRPGFVWSPHHWTASSHYMPIFILPLLSCAAIYSGAILLLLLAWQKLGRIKRVLLRRSLRSIILATFAYVVFCSLFGFSNFFSIFCCGAIGLFFKAKPSPNRFYLFCLIPSVFQELTWDILYKNTDITFPAIVISTSLYILLLSPVLAIKRNITRAIVYLFLATLSWSYFTWMNLYFDFFHDYPSFLMLNYATQLSSVLDSAFELLSFKHMLNAAYFIAPPLFLLIPLSTKQDSPLSPN